MGTATLMFVAFLVAIAVVGTTVRVLFRRRRTERIRARFGPDIARELHGVGDRRYAEARLEEREEGIRYFHIRPLTAQDRARFVQSWKIAQTQFLYNPGAAIAEADRLLDDIMITRGYPVIGFEQHAADISVDHPLVVENYRAAHAIALRHSQGRASTEELRQAMIHYRTLFENLIDQPKWMPKRIAS